MTEFIKNKLSAINKFKIPTLLGLAVIFAGMIVGVLLTIQNQTFITRATPDLLPKNIILTNIQDETISISWQTSTATLGFITFGESSGSEQTVLDDRDKTSPNPRKIHHVTLKKLKPQTGYFFKIFPVNTSEIQKFTTASPSELNNNFKPIIGQVIQNDQPIRDGVAYLLISGANTQSAIVTQLGNFIIPINKLREQDLKDTLAKIQILSDQGEAGAMIELSEDGKIPTSLIIGQNLDLTQKQTSAPSELQQFDLNSDNFINAADHAIILKNFGPLREAGKNPKDKRADLNSDGVVDQKDLDLIAKKINQ